MAEEVIRVEKLFKKYCRAPRRAILYATQDVFHAFFGLPARRDVLRPEEFWAVNDVSFSVHQGESLAVIGGNGSGKSTLLNMLNGVLIPDGGTIAARGRVGLLASLGAGFNTLLSGRENIAINGQMLGMSPRDIRAQSEAIIDFSEVRDFIDAPVHQYSSGMFLRLAFAIAVHAPVDILLIDEVLGVGDLAFSIKCRRKIVEFCNRGGAVVLVTHSMHGVKFGCNHAVWLDQGRVVRQGPAPDVASEYEKFMVAKANTMGESLFYDQRVQLRAFNYPRQIQSGESLIIDAELDASAPVQGPVFCLHLHASDGETLVFSHYSSDRAPLPGSLTGRRRLRMTTGPLNLKPGDYHLSFSLSERELGNYLFWHNRYYPLDIVGHAPSHGVYDAAVDFELQN